MCNTFDIIGDQKESPKTNKIAEVRKGKIDICGLSKSHIFSEQTTKGSDFEKRGKCKHGHCSAR